MISNKRPWYQLRTASWSKGCVAPGTAIMMSRTCRSALPVVLRYVMWYDSAAPSFGYSFPEPSRYRLNCYRGCLDSNATQHSRHAGMLHVPPEDRCGGRARLLQQLHNSWTLTVMRDCNACWW